MVSGQKSANSSEHRRTAIDVRMFSHSGNLLASSGWDGTTRLWDTQSGNLLVRTVGQFIQFSPDDRLLTYSAAFAHRESGTWLMVMNASPLHGHRTIGGARGPSLSMTEGTLLASCDSNGVHIWDTLLRTKCCTSHWG